MSVGGGEKFIRGGIWKESGVITVAIALACSAVLGGCKETEEAIETSGTDGGSRPQIGLNFDSLVIEWWIREWNVFVSTAKTLGVDVNTRDANGGVQKQIRQVEYFVRRQIDAIAVVVGDCGTLSGVMKKAKGAGIRTVGYDRLITNAGYDLYISLDNEEVGRLMARRSLEHVPEDGDIFMIQRPETDGDVLQVRKGFSEALAGSGLNVVYKTNYEGWPTEYAFAYVKERLAQHRDIEGVMCGNDDLATQAFQAFSEERPAGKVILTGQDGDLTTCQRIAESTQNITAFKSMGEETGLVAEYAVKPGRGGKPTNIAKIIDDSTYKISYRRLAPVAVTRDNMDEVTIKGRFHTEKDMHLNVRK